MATPGHLEKDVSKHQRPGKGSGVSEASGSSGSEGSAPVETPFELEEITLADLARGMERGRWSAESLVELYSERIAELDRGRVDLRSVIELNPDAPGIARDLDRERAQGGTRGPLHGIPILLKDNIATADRTDTAAGSLALVGVPPAGDSFVAGRLRRAGAVLLGKANLSEWANFRSTRSTSGWSARGGLCRNPYALDRNPGGSSSGSGAATSGNLVAAAVGTETDGSIICPASANGLVGVKPTVGRVSRSGIIPISATQDTAGPMARTVADAAMLLGALAGVDPRDPATTVEGASHPTDYTKGLDAGSLRGARIGVAREFFGFDIRVDALMEAALETMKERGATLIDPVQLKGRWEMVQASFQVLLYEFKDGIDRYLTALGPEAPVRSLADLIDFDRRHRDSEMPFFGQELFEQAQQKGPLTEKEYRDALETGHRLSRREGLDARMDAERLDAVVAPSGGPAWVSDLIRGDHHSGGSSSPAAIAGYPNVTVPAGAVFGLPVGISFFGRAWSEPLLLRLAFAYEQATHHRRAPRFRPTADLCAA
ncbi:MAG: amidase [Myxococcota bacterium]